MKNKVSAQFSCMNRNAYFMLIVCFNIILFSICTFYIYIDSSKAIDIAPLSYMQKEIITVYLSSITLNFVGAFLLDYQNKDKK